MNRKTPLNGGEILAKLYVEPTSECNLHGKEGAGNFFCLSPLV